MFAKLFNDTDVGQILVKIDQGSECEAEVRYYFEPPNLGVCSMAIQFEDDEAGSAWDKAEKAFGSVDLTGIVRMVQAFINEYCDV